MAGFIYVTLSIVFFQLDVTLVAADLSDVVETTKGRVRGEILRTVINSVSYTSFRGIPYAKPPIGHRRFKPPEEVDSWTEVLNATADANECPQIVNKVYAGDEDCLYLNVYTPKIKFNSNSNDELLPVMVWIYGGGFTMGTIKVESYGPDFLLDNGVVMVAMNYRLGALGFLSLDHANATGNAGLKDQVLALKWVQENIKNFGGDPAKVTIFGQSAGAASVELHKISDLSKGLFRSSIAMSGSPLSFWAFSSISDAVSRAFRLGRKLGLFTISKTDLLKKLYNATAEEIVYATANMSLVLIPFKPTYENKNLAAGNAFISKCAVERYQSGETDGLPHMLGFCNAEVIFLTKAFLPLKSVVDATAAHFASILKSTLGGIKILTDIFNGNIKNLDDLGTNAMYSFINVTSDFLFIEAIDRTQQYLTAKSSAPVYYYRNSFDYNASLHKLGGVNLNGTGHADDNAQIFWIPKSNQSRDPTSDIGIQRIKMARLFTNFAKYGNPTPNGTADTLLNVDWTPSGSEGKCLEITRDLKMGPRPTDELVKNVQKSIKLLEKSLNGCPLFS